jgi:ABC-type amino acid transport system permease subunit
MRAEPSPLERPGARSSVRARAITSIGPLTVLAGVLWAFAQPYRVTILHPRGQGFWWLAVEPPLLVILVGVLFGLVLAPGLLEDLQDEDG